MKQKSEILHYFVDEPHHARKVSRLEVAGVLRHFRKYPDNYTLSRIGKHHVIRHHWSGQHQVFAKQF